MFLQLLGTMLKKLKPNTIYKILLHGYSDKHKQFYSISDTAIFVYKDLKPEILCQFLVPHLRKFEGKYESNY